MRNFLILIMTAFLSAGEVTTYTPVTKGYGLKIYSGDICAATDGGLIIYSDGGYKVYDTDDGLYKPEILTAERDFRGKLWLGHPDCSVTVYDPVKKESVYLDDIPEAGVYDLNSITSSADHVYIATSGLLARYRYNPDYSKYEISDINTMTGSVRDAAVAGGRIYIAAGPGVYSIDEASPNINYLDNWSIVSGLGGAGTVNGFAVKDDTVFVLSGTGLYRIDGGVNAVKETVFDGTDLERGIFSGGEFLVMHEQVDAKVISSVPDDLSGIPEIIYGTEDTELHSFIRSGDILYFTGTGGLSFYSINGAAEYSVRPDLPVKKGIQKICFDGSSDRLIYLTGMEFSYMDPAARSFHGSMFSALATGDGAKNIHAKNGELYVCTWGAGLNVFAETGGEYSLVRNLRFGTAIQGSNYAVHPGISEDASGNLWITNWGDATDPEGSTMIRLAPDGQSYSYLTRDYFYGYCVTAVQRNGQTWIWSGSSRQSFGALDGISVGIFDGTNLNMKRVVIPDGVTDIEADRDGMIWIATNNGVRYVDPALSPSDPQSFSESVINTLQNGPVGNFIYDIEVNSINEKWFATDRGISVLSGDGTTWRHYVPMYHSGAVSVPGTVIRTALPDETVNSILFLENEGLAAVCSYNGISFIEYGRIFKTGEVKKNEIQTRPSPFLNDGSAVMGFYLPDDGNAYDTGKIFDMRGFLIRGGDGSDRFDILNGWDGRDNDGNIVPSGIYRIVVYNRNDPSRKITGKIAAVRK